MKSILITGCNRGLGLGLVKHLVNSSKPPESIFATCRDADKAVELRTLAEKSKNIRILEVDLADIDSYESIARAVSEKVGESGLNVLFNNAGVSSKFTRLGLVKESQLNDAFLVNTVAPIMLTKALLPLLRKAAVKETAREGGMSIHRAAVINMSSILGSIEENQQGGYYPYRCSKAALNAATKSMSVDLKDNGILVASLHPGWVRTDLGGRAAPMDIDTSVIGILSTLENLTEEHTGSFVQYDGKIVPW